MHPLTLVDRALIVGMVGCACLLVGLAIVWFLRQFRPFHDADGPGRR